jgi:histone H3/H4
MLVVASKVKAMAKAGGLRTSQEFIDALSAKIEDLVIAAAKAAKDKNRQTLKARDLPEPDDE